MATGIQLEKLDDIQLAIYIAAHASDSVRYSTEVADGILNWIKEKRAEETENNKSSISELLNNK